MNLDDLRSVQSKERQKDSLQHLRDSFYADVGEYVSELKDERDRAADRADDPFSSEEVGRLTDEIETAEEVVEAIYERRMGKLVKRASLAAAGMPSDEEGLTAEEQDLFEDLVERIETNKAHVLDVLSGEVDGSAGDADPRPSDAGEAPTDAGGAPPDAATASDDADAGASPPSPGQTDPAAPDAAPPPVDGDRSDADDADSSADRPADEASPVSAADLMGGGESDAGADGSPEPTSGADDGDAASGDAEGDAAPSGSAAPADDGSGADAADGPGDSPHVPDADPGALDEDRTTVRIMEDIGEIFGVDEREYELSAEDVVTLPETNAEPLIERDAAERLD